MESLKYLEISLVFLFRVNQNTCALPFLSLSVRDTFSVAICFVRFYIYMCISLYYSSFRFLLALILIVAFC